MVITTVYMLFVLREACAEAGGISTGCSTASGRRCVVAQRGGHSTRLSTDHGTGTCRPKRSLSPLSSISQSVIVIIITVALSLISMF